ncbi:MFS transporter [Micromonospora sp. KLBMP9576]|uniref:MFS transporter n=1 Tax=Micromonospora sp. KLBMP9576 TaxID=3424769 RepID=UPI003D9139F2
MTDALPDQGAQRQEAGPAASGFRTWSIILLGQFASMLGSNFTSFALAVHVYRTTDSATALGVILALGLLPAAIASPFAGSLVDRWGSKRTLLISSVGSMVVMLAMAPLLTGDGFQVWQVYVIVILTSALTSLQIPALGAVTPLLVPKKHLGRANGLRMVAIAVSQVLAPVSAGLLLTAIDLRGIIILDIVSYGLAIVTISLVRVPRLRRVPAAPGTRSNLLSEFAEGWRYVAARGGLLTLLFFLASINFSAGFMELLINPLVLSFASTEALGVVLSVGGVGMVVAGAAVSIWGGPKRKIRGVLLFALVLAVSIIVGSTRPNVALIAVSAFVFLGALVALATAHQVIWQTKVEPHLLGRVMALITMVGLIPQLFANLFAGLAVDHVFEPLVGRDSVSSPAIAALVGDGPGRGIALCMMLVGVLVAVSTAIAALSPRLRRLEDDLPDVIAKTEDTDDDAAVEPEAERVVEEAYPSNR